MGMMVGRGPGSGGPAGRLDTEDISLKDVDFSYMPRLKEFVKPYAGGLIAAMLMVAATSALSLVGPVLIRRAIDIAVPARNTRLLSIIAAEYIGIMTAIAALQYFQTYIMSWAGQNMLYSMRKKLFTHLQDLGLDFYDRLQAGRIMSRVTNDVEALNQLISSGTLNLLSDVITLVGIILVMLRMHTKLALVSFVTLPLLFFTVWSLRLKMTRAYHKVRRRMADINANLQESISGIKVTQAFSREDINAERFSNTNQESFQANLEAARLHAVFFPLIDVISALGSAIVLYFGGKWLFNQDSTLTIGTLAAFLNYVTRFFMPVRNLSEMYNLLLQAGVSAERVFEVLDTKPNVEDKPGAVELGRIEGHVLLDNVTFGYTPDLPVLHGVTIEALPGQTIALVGPTGAGKTSVINLVCRFYDIQEGRVLIDGHDVRDVTLESLRKNLGIVLQDTFIFSGTVKDNIRYGRLEATDEEVVEAAKLVGAHEFIMRLPDGYDTQVRERGSRLSVGQRQLIAFARALLADPRILILDEATSSVDSYTEVLIQRALERLLKGRTSIVIAHRLSTIRNADVIYVIDSGRVVEKGSHEDLMALGGEYKKLYEKQFASQESPQDGLAFVSSR